MTSLKSRFPYAKREGAETIVSQRISGPVFQAYKFLCKIKGECNKSDLMRATICRLASFMDVRREGNEVCFRKISDGFVLGKVIDFWAPRREDVVRQIDSAPSVLEVSELLSFMFAAKSNKSSAINVRVMGDAGKALTYIFSSLGDDPSVKSGLILAGAIRLEALFNLARIKGFSADIISSDGFPPQPFDEYCDPPFVLAADSRADQGLGLYSFAILS